MERYNGYDKTEQLCFSWFCDAQWGQVHSVSSDRGGGVAHSFALHSDTNVILTQEEDV